MELLVKVNRINRQGRYPLLPRRARLVQDHLQEAPELPSNLLERKELKAAYTVQGRLTAYTRQDFKKDILLLRGHGLAELTTLEGAPVLGSVRVPTEPEICRAKKAGNWDWINDGLLAGEAYSWRLSNLLFEAQPVRAAPRGGLRVLWDCLPEWPFRLEDLPMTPEAKLHYEGPQDVFEGLMALHRAGFISVQPVGL